MMDVITYPCWDYYMDVNAQERLLNLLTHARIKVEPC